MRHATVDALLMVRGKTSFAGYPQGAINACNRGTDGGFWGCAAAEKLALGKRVDLPDCPTCLVLLDAALERLPDPFEAARKDAAR